MIHNTLVERHVWELISNNYEHVYVNDMSDIEISQLWISSVLHDIRICL